jgi:osomolarity two-component system phosphorelay intermediate protein YPD1
VLYAYLTYNLRSFRAIKDLGKLSSLGHFLKGSSAALGVAKVQASCELIQHYGQLHDLEHRELTSDIALGRIEILLSQVKEEYTDAERWLKDWYNGAGATASTA